MSKPKNTWISKHQPGYRRTWSGHCLHYYEGNVHKFQQEEFPHLSYESIKQHLIADGSKISDAGFLETIGFQWE